MDHTLQEVWDGPGIEAGRRIRRTDRPFIMMRFRDRKDAGRRLAEALRNYAARPDVIVLGLPRGGVLVAAEVAAALEAPLDVLVVRKLGVPGQEELAMGAVASGNVLVVNEEVIRPLRITGEEIAAAAARERREIARREREYRGERPYPDLKRRTVILVDDGLATGATMKAAVAAARERAPARIVVAVPTGSREACTSLAREADEVVCLASPDPFTAVGAWYEYFPQIGDDEVRRMSGRVDPGASGDPWRAS